MANSPKCIKYLGVNPAHIVSIIGQKNSRSQGSAAQTDVMGHSRSVEIPQFDSQFREGM